MGEKPLVVRPLQFRTMNEWRKDRTTLVCGVVVLVAMAVVYFALGSCDGPEKAGSLPPLTTPSPEVTSATPTPASSPPVASPAAPPSPTVPANLTPVQRDAVDWVLRQNDEYNRALNSGDTKKFASLMTKKCSCRQVVSLIEKEWRKGSIKAPNYSTITRIKGFTMKDQARLTDGTRLVVQGVQVLGAEHVLNKDRKRVYDAPPQPPVPTDYYLERDNGDWRLAHVDFPNGKKGN